MRLIKIAACITLTASISLGCCFTSLKGRVLDEYGRGSSNTFVYITGCFELPCTSALVRMTRTNSFGYFKFNDILLTEYVLEAKNKLRYKVLLVPTYEYEYIEITLERRTNYVVTNFGSTSLGIGSVDPRTKSSRKF